MKITWNKIALWALIALAVIASLYFFISSAQGKVPTVFGFSVIRVQTGSMSPAIEPGTYFLSQYVSPDRIVKDDIITFYSDDPAIYGKPNTHRVVEVINRSDGGVNFVTKGDANPANDTVNANGDKLIGRYVTSLPAISAIFGFLMLPFVFIPIIILAAAFCIYSFVKDMRSAKQEDNIDELVAAEVERLKRENSSENINNQSADDKKE